MVVGDNLKFQRFASLGRVECRPDDDKPHTFRRVSALYLLTL